MEQRRKHLIGKIIFKCSFISFVFIVPIFILWLGIAPKHVCGTQGRRLSYSTPENLSSSTDRRLLPEVAVTNEVAVINEAFLSPVKRLKGFTKVVFLLFLFCVFVGWTGMIFSFIAGLKQVYPTPMTGDTFFPEDILQPGIIKKALCELGTITNFSVAASEPKSLLIRSWLGKITTATDGCSNVATFGVEGLPIFVDFFADEKHSNQTVGLWQTWVKFVATSPSAAFLGKWATSLEGMTMKQAQDFDPFSAELLRRECQLPTAQVAAVRQCEEHEVSQVEARVGDANKEAEIRLSDDSVRALTELRSEYVLGKLGSMPTSYAVSDDRVMHMKVEFHGHHLEMIYAARGKPNEKQVPKLKTRKVATDHWVCLSESFFRSFSERETFWTWARASLDVKDGDGHPKSEWEILRSCYARVNGPVGTSVQLSEPSVAMKLFLEQCFLGEELPVACLDPYLPARGKAGALNFAVRLLNSRHVLTTQTTGDEPRESLFAIFDARHMPCTKFWYDAIPLFFQAEPTVCEENGHFSINRDVGFIQAPQKFAKLPAEADILDMQNSFFFESLNTLRNKAGAVTSCGTNAVWLLPRGDHLPHLGPRGQEGWWDSNYFEEATKIEDTATSHRLISEGKHSIYLNNHERPSCIGIAKDGPNYLAAVERWTEGSVQLFWLTLFRGPCRRRLLASMSYFYLWSFFIFSLIIFKPQVICKKGTILGDGFCLPSVNAYLDHKASWWSYEEEWRLSAEQAYLQLVENTIFVVAFIILNFAATLCLDWGRLMRTIVVFDNMTNYVAGQCGIFWMFLSVYVALGFESPFTYNSFDLVCWFFFMTLARWGLFYGAKMQGSASSFAIWRSQQAYVIGCPNQIFAMIQGTKAAWDIMRHEVDKSWWIDPTDMVRRISKSWTLFWVVASPGLCIYVIFQACLGKCTPVMLVGLILVWNWSCVMLKPMLFIWGLSTKNLDRFLKLFPSNWGGIKGITVCIRVGIEICLPVMSILLLSPKSSVQDMWGICSEEY